MTEQNNIVLNAEENTLKTTHGEQGKFILFPVRVTGITGVVTLKNTKVIDNETGLAITSKRLRGSTLDVIPTDRLRFISQCRDDIKAVFRKYGFNLGSSLFMVHEDKIDKVLDLLKVAKDKFESELVTFVDTYDDLIEGEMLLNPSLSKLIETHAPKKDKIARSCKFKVGTPQAINVGQQHIVESELFDQEGDYFSDEVVTSFCSDVTHFWRYSLQTAKKVLENDGKDRENFINPIKKRSGLRGTCLMILKNIRDKAEDVTLINPSFTNVTEYMDAQVDLIGGYDHHGSYIKDLKTAKILLTLAENLKNEDFINSLLTVTVDESFAAELVNQSGETVIDNQDEPAFSLDDLMDSDTTLLNSDAEGNAETEEPEAFSLDDLMTLDTEDLADAENKTSLAVKADVAFSEEDVTCSSISTIEKSDVEDNDVSNLLSSQEEAKAEALTKTFSIDDLFN